MEIPKEDLASLSLLCGVEAGQPIKPEVLAHYWRARRLTSRLGNCGAIPATTLVQVGLCAGLGYEEKVDQVEERFSDKVRLGKVLTGDTIEVIWRKEPKQATFQLVRGDGEIEVLFDDHKVPRAIPENDCKAIKERVVSAPPLPELGEGVIISKRRLRMAEAAAQEEARAKFQDENKAKAKAKKDAKELEAVA
jgi:hypothetical protein